MAQLVEHLTGTHEALGGFPRGPLALQKPGMVGHVVIMPPGGGWRQQDQKFKVTLSCPIVPGETMSQQNKVSEEIKHLQSTTLKQNAILGGMRLRVTWHPWVEILNRKWTLENHPSVDKAEMLIHLCYRVCSL